MTLREELREKTAHLHGQAEAALELMSPALSLQKYLSVLRVLHAFHSQVEPALLSHAGFAGLGLDMRARRKLPLLARDLEFLQDKNPRALESASPAFSSFPAALGAAYVVEGATLGGAVIYRYITPVLGLLDGDGTRFFHGAGNQTGPRWKQFVAALGLATLDAADQQRAAEGARHAFELLLELANPTARCSPPPAARRC